MSALREALEELAEAVDYSDQLEGHLEYRTDKGWNGIAYKLRAMLTAHPEPETVTEWGVIERPTMRVTGDMDSNVIPVHSESDARHHVKTKPSFYVGVAHRVKAGPWERAE